MRDFKPPRWEDDYAAPEGFTKIYSRHDGGYEWTQLDIWQRDEDGRLFAYSGSGCSCNSPYDYVKNLEDLQPITNLNQLRSTLDRQYLMSAVDAVEVVRCVAYALTDGGEIRAE
jgi:hypothetical protein